MAVEKTQARELLIAAEGARRRTRSVLSTNWFPMILFGSIALVSVPAAEFWSQTAMEALWLFGAPLAVLATGQWYRTRQIEIGISVNPWPYVITSVGIMVGCIATGIAGRGGPVSYAGPLLVIGLGYLVFARLDHSLAGGVLGGALAVTAILVFAFRPQHAYAVTMLLFGAGSVSLGLWSVQQARRAE